MSVAVSELVLTPSSARRPSWLSAGEWERMPWPARMRAARRALHLVPTQTDDGTDPTHGWLGGTSAPVATPAVPSSPVVATCPRCGRPTTPTLCDPCAQVLPPVWLQSARRDLPVLQGLAKVTDRHITHPTLGGRDRRKARSFRPVVPGEWT